jgi:DNA ligase (NAD+)
MHEDLTAIDDIGPRIADSIVAYFSDAKNQALIEKLRAHGVDMTAEKKTLINTTFDGEIVVLTGKLQMFSRKEAEQAVEARGGKCTSSVTKKTTLVVVGADPGSKYEKAKKLGTPIISESRIQRMARTKEMENISKEDTFFLYRRIILSSAQ